MRVMITGANRGIGLATAKLVAARGHDLLITARTPEKGEFAAEEILRAASRPSVEVDSAVLDLASLDSVRGFAGGLDPVRGPDIVLHNGGPLVAQPTRRLTDDGIEELLQVHAVAPLYLTALLSERLGFPRRVATTSSGLHRPGSRGEETAFSAADPNLDENYHPDRSYKNAKLAQLWFVLEWERRFGEAGSHGDAICPGFVPETAATSATGFSRFTLRWVMPRFSFANSLQNAAESMAHWILRPLDEPAGVYFDSHEVCDPGIDARDPAKAAAFWDMVGAWTGFDFDELIARGEGGT